MKPGAASRKKQSGVALIMLLAALILAGGYAFYRSSNSAQGRTQQSVKVTSTLARAKEALIARAVTDANRPGSLPCPDLITDDAGLINHPGDGKADNFIGAATAECPSYIGWLPWITLDLPEQSDDSGTRLWYALSPTLRDDNSAQPINSDTPIDLRIDGGGEIAAIIIATGRALPGQARPSNNPADYLEGDNANGDSNYVNGPATETFNDVVTIITRQELMAAVEKRVATEVKVCIEQHAQAAANTTHSYPWPAPFASLDFRGKSGSYFGQVPATQPSAPLDLTLAQNITQLQTAKNAVSSATQASDQLTAVEQLTEAFTQSRNIYDVMYVVATKLWQSASSTASFSAVLNSEITTDLIPSSTGRVAIINSEQTRIRTAALTVKNQIDGIYTAIDDSGIDVFPNQLKIRSNQYQAQRSTVNAEAIQLLLASSTTTHADIGPALANALAASGTAVTAASNLAATPEDPVAIAAATAASTAFDTSLSSLQTTISKSRINQHYSEVSPYATQLSALNAVLSSAPNAANAASLATRLAEIKLQLESIQTGASAINASRISSLSAINQALTAAQAAIDYPLITTTTGSAISSIESLVTTMMTNDDNLTRTSLAAAIADFKTEQTTFASLNIADTAARVPYALSLQNVTVDVKFWSEIIAAEADALARQAKGVPITLGEDFAKVTPLSTSAFLSAENALLSGQTATTALQAYIKTPTTAKQTAASIALADTLSKTADLLAATNTTDTMLNSSTASALPIIWLSSRCDAFRETADSWWNNNQWKNLVFYQISDANITATPGKLKVNQTGNYRVVVINSGGILPLPCPQDPPVIWQSHGARNAINFFEEINADNSRDNNADSPDISINFISKTQSSCFNDRLAY